jgi:hypothetical protein
MVPALGPEPATTPPVFIIKEPELNVNIFEPGLKTPPLLILKDEPGVKVILDDKVKFHVSPTVMVELVNVPVLTTVVAESN